MHIQTEIAELRKEVKALRNELDILRKTLTDSKLISGGATAGFPPVRGYWLDDHCRSPSPGEFDWSNPDKPFP